MKIGSRGSISRPTEEGSFEQRLEPVWALTIELYRGRVGCSDIQVAQRRFIVIRIDLRCCCCAAAAAVRGTVQTENLVANEQIQR